MDKTYHVAKAMLREIEKYNTLVPEREVSMDWEIIHMLSCGRLGYMLGLKRGVDPTIASCACLVHDIGRIATGKRKDHALSGYEKAKNLLRIIGFEETDVEEMGMAVRNHSYKDEIGEPLEEIVKDADVLDYYYFNGKLTREDMVRRLSRIRKEDPSL